MKYTYTLLFIICLFSVRAQIDLGQTKNYVLSHLSNDTYIEINTKSLLVAKMEDGLLEFYAFKNGVSYLWGEELTDGEKDEFLNSLLKYGFTKAPSVYLVAPLDFNDNAQKHICFKYTNGLYIYTLSPTNLAGEENYLWCITCVEKI